ncbi:RagB/SusD family nutrient uptake outer membrane protein [Paraflavisolibacter sp. H34]|uniref:RagB/SusD family nutrient uptake outer membrane protein n=1 Tax=Huijunlia imazamoxiresistens TaxID=3127457 RepID=UPI003018FC25
MKQRIIKGRTSSTLVGMAAVVALLAASCKKLDMPSKSAYESDVIFDSPVRVTMAVQGIYPIFKGTAMATYFTPDNDESTSSNTSGERYGLSKYDFGPANNQMKPVFDQRYTGVNRANECIEGLEKAGVLTSGTAADQKTYNALYGEALALRAWAYFDLVRFWGDVPFPLTPAKAGENFFLPRVSRDTIYDRILADLKVAEERVPWASEVGYRERITKGAVKGLIARIALHAAGYSLRWDLQTRSGAAMRQRSDAARITQLYELAKKACEDVMLVEGTQHALAPDFVSVFKDSHNKRVNKENIFELGNYGLSANDGVGYYIGISVGTVAGTYLQAAPQVRALPTYYYSFDAADTRRDVTVGNFSVEAATANFNIVGINNLTCGKWRKTWQEKQGSENAKTDINWIVLRYSDILLMYAEAANELGGVPSAEAKEALKKVRRRAFPTAVHQEKVEEYVNALASKEAFREALIKERAFELGFEANLRRTDLVRWNRLAGAIADTRAKLAVLATGVDPYTGRSIPRYRVYQKKSWVGSEPVAVPFTESATNTGLASGYAAVDFMNAANVNALLNNFAKAFQANKTELMPLHQSVIDANPTLKNAQHPGY